VVSDRVSAEVDEQPPELLHRQLLYDVGVGVDLPRAVDRGRSESGSLTMFEPKIALTRPATDAGSRSRPAPPRSPSASWRLVGRPDIADQPWFDPRASGSATATQLGDIVASWIGARDFDQVMRAFEEAGAAIAPIYDIEQLMGDPQVEALDAITTIEDEDLGADGGKTSCRTASCRGWIADLPSSLPGRVRALSAVQADRIGAVQADRLGAHALIDLSLRCALRNHELELNQQLHDLPRSGSTAGVHLPAKQLDPLQMVGRVAIWGYPKVNTYASAPGSRNVI
jgi:hypothetical protein